MTNPAGHSLLISDLHLCDERPDLNNAFKEFCNEYAKHADALYILGDLSDAWVGDDDDCTTATLIREQLSQLTDSGVSVFLMTGNRDFLMGKQLASDTGAKLLTDPGVVDLYGTPTLLMHGDSLCIDDAEYMAFRAQIQNPQAQQMLLAQSLDERRALAKSLRSQSKSANSNKAEDIMDVNQQAVVEVMNEHGVKKLIHGHTHRPDTHQLPDIDATRIVLGDWGDKVWYVKASAEKQDLITYSLNS